MNLGNDLIKLIRQKIHGSDDESLPLPIVGAEPCSSYHEGQADEVVSYSRTAHTEGVIFEAHKHKNDHIAQIYGGLALVDIEDQDDIILDHGGECLIPAGKNHRVICLEVYLKKQGVIAKCVFPWGFD
jgi:hypothetical protein